MSKGSIPTTELKIHKGCEGRESEEKRKGREGKGKRREREEKGKGREEKRKGREEKGKGREGKGKRMEIYFIHDYFYFSLVLTETTTGSSSKNWTKNKL